MLFDTYLPQTWAAIVPVLTEDDHAEDMYGLWPPHQPTAHTGDSVYWQSLPRKVLQQFISSQAPVWPVLRATSSRFTVEKTTLDKVLVAPPRNSDIDAVTLMALVRAGIRIVRPPEYVFDILKEDFSNKFTLLDPSSASSALQVRLFFILSRISLTIAAGTRSD